MHDPAIATAADYADAMLTARKAKNVLVLILLLLVLAQLTIFFLVRFDVVSIGLISSAMSTTSTSQPSANSSIAVHYFGSLFLFLGVTVSIVLSFVLLLIVNIMLVGRLIGVSRVVSAYLWCLVLLILLFPWQAFLNNAGLTLDQATFKVPGILYTWGELSDPVRGAKFLADPLFPVGVLRWSRFAVFPFVAVIILLVIQVKSNRGIRQALGEDESPTLPADHNT